MSLRGLALPAISSSNRRRTAVSTASSSAGNEAMTMTTSTTLERPDTLSRDPLAAAIADIEGLPEPASVSEMEQRDPAPTKTKQLVIVDWSGELDRVWPVLILSSTAAASGVRCKVFVTFW